MIGASFAEFLDEHGLRDDVESQAVKELIVEQIAAKAVGRAVTITLT